MKKYSLLNGCIVNRTPKAPHASKIICEGSLLRTEVIIVFLIEFVYTRNTHGEGRGREETEGVRDVG